MHYGPLKPKDVQEASACISPHHIVPKALTTDKEKKLPVWPKTSPCPNRIIIHLFFLYVMLRHNMK